MEIFLILCPCARICWHLLGLETNEEGVALSSHGFFMLSLHSGLLFVLQSPLPSTTQLFISYLAVCWPALLSLSAFLDPTLKDITFHLSFKLTNPFCILETKFFYPEHHKKDRSTTSFFPKFPIPKMANSP